MPKPVNPGPGLLPRDALDGTGQYVINVNALTGQGARAPSLVHIFLETRLLSQLDGAPLSFFTFRIHTLQPILLQILFAASHSRSRLALQPYNRETLQHYAFQHHVKQCQLTGSRNRAISACWLLWLPPVTATSTTRKSHTSLAKAQPTTPSRAGSALRRKWPQLSRPRPKRKAGRCQLQGLRAPSPPLASPGRSPTSSPPGPAASRKLRRRDAAQWRPRSSRSPRLPLRWAATTRRPATTLRAASTWTPLSILTTTASRAPHSTPESLASTARRSKAASLLINALVDRAYASLLHRVRKGGLRRLQRRS